MPTFRNGKKDWTYNDVDWSNVSIDILRTYALAQMKVGLFDSFLEGKDPAVNLGTIKIADLLANKGKRGEVSVEGAMEALKRNIAAGKLTQEDAIAQVKALIG